MSFELRVFFTGLCFFSEKNENEWRSLLVDGYDGYSSDREDHDAKPHIGVIQFDEKNIVKSESDRFPKSSFGRFGWWFLDREYVEFRGKGSTSPSERIQADRTAIGAGPRLSDKNSINWITPIEGINSSGNIDRGNVSTDLIDPVGNPRASDLLTACIRINRGEVLPAAFGSSFRPPIFRNRLREQCYASVVMLRQEIEEPGVEFFSTRFNNNPGHKLCLKPEDGRDFVEVWVMNIELDQLLNPVDPELSGWLRIGESNPEYKMLENIITNPLADGRQTVISNLSSSADLSNLMDVYRENRLLCSNRFMRRHYFTMVGGQTLLSQPCSPGGNL